MNPEHGNHDIYKCDNIKISRLKHVCICIYYILVLTWSDIVYHAFGMIEVIRKWYLKALLVFVERNPYVNILPQLDTHR